MPSADWAREAAAVWDIATPSRTGRLAGVSMAGFRQRTTDDVDLGMVPFPAVTVGIAFGGAPLIIVDAAGRQHSGSAVIGLAPAGLRVRGRGIECVQVRLSPVVAHAVLGATGEVGGSVITLDDLWGRQATRIEDRLAAAASWDDRFVIIEDALARRLDAHRATDPEVAFIWGQMVACHGQVRIDELAADAGWSRKRLWSRFRAQVGLTPKRAAQLVRFDDAAHRLAAGYGPAVVAAETGYADQSHLHRDTIAFAGVAPTAVATAAWLAVDDIAWTARRSASSF